ncbi:MAG: PP2C family protein-serine/threonine phosphatase [Jatrophihabitans sp.]
MREALDQARPDATIAVLRPLLAEHLDVSEVRLLLANYQLTALRPIEDPEDRQVLRDTPPGQAFETQQPVTRPAPGQGVLVYLPVSIRGDRIGVLQLALPTDPGASGLRELNGLAVVIAHAVQAASRHTDAVQRAARSQRLSLAAELQWQLLPGRGCQAPEYQLAGHLEPAYHVRADNFDWSQDGDQLMLSVTDAARAVQGASLLTTLAVTALRNARRARLGPADQVCLADQAIYAYHQGREYLSTLLVRIDLNTGHASAVRAGSPRLFILRDHHVHQPRLREQDPLGMFEGTDYTEDSFSLATGDRMLLVSDGVHAARSPTHEQFANGRLPQLLAATRHHSVGAVVRAIIDDLFDHRDLAELDDDAAVLCLDWAGPGEATVASPDPSDSADVPAERPDGSRPRLAIVTSASTARHTRRRDT